MLPKSFKIEKIVMENAQTKTFLLDGKYNAKPGQFVMVWLPDINEKPMSLGSSSPISLSIANVGGFSSSMHSLKEGDRIWLRGPLGNFYTPNGKSIVLVAGGYGVAPLRFLAKELMQKGMKVKMIMGARNKDLMMLPPPCETIMTTNDGSIGIKGFVTDALETTLQNEQIDMVCSCGPELMLYNVAKICEKYNVESQLSGEREMKCGIGLCGSCIMDETLVCVDGPIFRGSDLLKTEEFGKWKRDATGAKVKA